MKQDKKKKRPKPPQKTRRTLRQRYAMAISNFRLSLTFRIALHYVGRLLSTTLGYILLFTVFYIFMQVPGIMRTVDDIQQNLPEQAAYDTPYSTKYHDVDITLTDTHLSEDSNVFSEEFEIAFSPDLFRWPSLLRLGIRAPEGTWIYSINLTSRIEIYVYLTGMLVLFDIMRCFGFMNKRNYLSTNVLKPIRDMSDMAATLSANNLSNRLNIAGTKNELKDLAVVINSMLDRIERSYNSQKQFVSDASHELRTPIAVMQGYIGMLKRWGKDDKEVLDEAISAIAQETESMKDLVESLLFLARHDKKTLLLEMEDFDPCEVMAAVHRDAKMVSADYEFNLSPLDHCVIRADKNMIKQVVRVLCDNAVKYTPEGGTVTLGCQAVKDGCMLTVSDTGTGISQEDLPKIFDRFYRSDGARKAQSSGHGLGLSIARIIIIAHEGKLSVKSKVGVGTTFTVFLPTVFQSKQSI